MRENNKKTSEIIKILMKKEELRRKELVVFLLLILIVMGAITFWQPGGITGAITGVEGAEIEEEVFSELSRGGNVSVIVVLKEDDEINSEDLEEREEGIREKQDEVLENLNLEEKEVLFGMVEEEKEFEVGHRYSTINAFSGEVTEEGLEKLEWDPGVEKVFLNKVLHPVLDVSAPQINSNDVLAMQVGGVNITGRGETVCVIDTGIDTDHSAFTGRILDEYCYCRVKDLGSGGCCPDQTTEDDGAEDDQGHGTHVSGIAAGNHSTYRGVAPEAGIISIKVCDNGAQASCNTDDVIAAIGWCTDNSTTYNISVISISLGDGGQNNDYCSGNAMASAINSAWAKNISVVISSGNEGYTAGISGPACVQNATPVGAVNSADAISYNRGAILEIVAPGVSIDSPYNNGGTVSLSGTSMACPHVSGVELLVKQYWEAAYNETILPDEVESKLFLVGQLVDDTDNSNRNYSRVDALKGVQPFINFTDNSEANGTTIGVTHALVNISADVNLSVALLEWNNGTLTNYTMNVGNGTVFDYNITGLGKLNHTYKVYGNDTVGTWGVSEVRAVEIDNTPPNITVYRPANNSYWNAAFDLNVTVENVLLSYSRYNISNSSGVLIQTGINASVGSGDLNWTDTVNVSNASFADDNYTLRIWANDSLKNIGVEVIEFAVDKTEPLLFSLNRSLDVVYNNDTVVFSVNATDLYLNGSLVFLEANFSGGLVNYTMVLDSGDQFNYSVVGGAGGNFSNQENVTYRFYATDFAGNVNVSNLSSFGVENRVLIGVNITFPPNGTILEVGNSTQFTGAVVDPDGDSLSYVWNFSDGNTSSVQNPTYAFNVTGTYLVLFNVSDSYSANWTNVTVVVNDSSVPNITSITYDSSVHLESEVNQSFDVVVFDHSGIFNLTVDFGGVVQNRTCSAQGVRSWTCSWGWANMTVGDYSFTVNSTDDDAGRNANSTTYSFSVVSCSDNVKNGNEGGVDCGGSCASACTVSGTGGGSGGGGGGGGAGSTTACTTGAISCVGNDKYKECLSVGTTNEWSENKDVSSGMICKFGALVEEEVEVGGVAETEVVGETEEAVGGDDEEAGVAEGGVSEKAVDGEVGKGLAGRAFGFFKGVGEWKATGKILFGLSGLAVILLVIYFLIRKKARFLG